MEICWTDIVGKWDLKEFRFFVFENQYREVERDVDVRLMIEKIYVFTSSIDFGLILPP